MSTDHASDSTTPPTQPPNEETAHQQNSVSKMISEGFAQRDAKAAEDAVKAKQAQITSEAKKRICLDLPARTHLRFKKACVSTNRKMTTELLILIEQRIVELEKEAIELDNAAKRQDAIN